MTCQLAIAKRLPFGGAETVLRGQQIGRDLQLAGEIAAGADKELADLEPADFRLVDQHLGRHLHRGSRIGGAPDDLDRGIGGNGGGDVAIALLAFVLLGDGQMQGEFAQLGKQFLDRRADEIVKLVEVEINRHALVLWTQHAIGLDQADQKLAEGDRDLIADLVFGDVEDDRLAAVDGLLEIDGAGAVADGQIAKDPGIQQRLDTGKERQFGRAKTPGMKTALAGRSGVGKHPVRLMTRTLTAGDQVFVAGIVHKPGEVGDGVGGLARLDIEKHA